jgi:galactokinase
MPFSLSTKNTNEKQSIEVKNLYLDEMVFLYGKKGKALYYFVNGSFYASLKMVRKNF